MSEGRATAWKMRFFGLGLTLAVAAAGAWMQDAGGSRERVPTQEDIGTTAVGSIRAGRDYDIPDDEITRRRQDEAASDQLPIYDLDAKAAEETVARVGEAFTAARLASSGAARQAFVQPLQLSIPEDDLAVFRQARFAIPVEDGVKSLINLGLKQLWVVDASLLDGDRDRGIILRTPRSHQALVMAPLAMLDRMSSVVLEADPPEQRILTDLSAIKDSVRIRAEIERASTAMADPLLAAPVAARLHDAMGRLAIASLRPTLVWNAKETLRRQREARDRVKPVILQVRRGEVILADGERIEQRHLSLLKAIRNQTRSGDRLAMRLGSGLLICALLLVLGGFGALKRLAMKDLALAGLLFVATLGLASSGFALADVVRDRLPWLPPEALYYLVPFATGAVVLRMVLLPPDLAFRFAVASGPAVGLMLGHSVFFTLYAMLTSLAAAERAGHVQSRSGLWAAGAQVGLLGAAVVAATHLLTGRGVTLDLGLAAAGALLGNAVLLPISVVLLLPLMEGGFGYITSARLRKLVNLNHPVLKDLIVKAPGTYHHSIVIGNLVDSAAAAIGGNRLLARAAAYYHDIGKMRSPLNFDENQKSDNRHDSLPPSTSALMVKRHVADGLALAQELKLPRVVSESIAQHHGTRKISFFWEKAKRRAAQNGEIEVMPTEEEERVFRYDGPKPHHREIALVMIADACEASTRSLGNEVVSDGASSLAAEQLHRRVREAVSARIREIIEDDQLDQCDFTLSELRATGEALVQGLVAIYLPRGGSGVLSTEGAPAAPAAIEGPSSADLSATVIRFGRPS